VKLTANLAYSGKNRANGVLAIQEISVMLRVLFGFVIAGLSMVAMADGDAAKGKQHIEVCAACHGTDGNSPAPSFPSIAGQNSSYLVKQMKEIKSGDRSSPLMTGLLDDFSDQDLADIAAYYEGQSVKGGAAKADLVDLGEAIYRAGVKRKNIAACTSCHSPNGDGNGPATFPALAGQWPEYTESQLRAFRSGERTNDGDSRMMRITAMDLSDDEIAAVSSYIYGLQ
jgi:cytochrome c553